VIGFGAGEPDFDTPEHIKQAAVEALQKGDTKYTPASGTPQLKAAIATWTNNDLGLDYTPAEVVVSCGAKHSLYNIIMALCQEGDEVIIPSPYWLSYPEMVTLAGAKSVFLRLKEEEEFRVDLPGLKKLITPKTKALILNSPSNPTGTMWTEEEMRQVAQLALERDFFIISDDTYNKITYGEQPFQSIVSLVPEVKEKAILVNCVSKTYAMTGWRIGWALGPTEIIKAIGGIQSHSTSNPTSFAQAGAVAALEGPQECVGVMVQEFKARRDLMMELLSHIPQVKAVKPTGAFYVFVNVSACYGKSYDGFTVKSSLDMVKFLLDKFFLALVDGASFGSDDHVRLSYATGRKQIEEGVKRLGEGLSALA
jgi:aspartate aminotransferase